MNYTMNEWPGGDPDDRWMDTGSNLDAVPHVGSYVQTCRAESLQSIL